MDFHSIATVVTFPFLFFFLHAFLCVGEAEESTQSSREILRVGGVGGSFGSQFAQFLYNLRARIKRPRTGQRHHVNRSGLLDAARRLFKQTKGKGEKEGN